MGKFTLSTNIDVMKNDSCNTPQRTDSVIRQLSTLYHFNKKARITLGNHYTLNLSGIYTQLERNTIYEEDKAHCTTSSNL